MRFFLSFNPIYGISLKITEPVLWVTLWKTKASKRRAWLGQNVKGFASGLNVVIK